MSNTQYIFSHRLTTNCTASPRAVIIELTELMDFTELAVLTELLPLWSSPIYILSTISTVCNISVGQLGLAAWLCSLPALAHPLVSQTWETEKKSLIS